MLSCHLCHFGTVFSLARGQSWCKRKRRRKNCSVNNSRCPVDCWWWAAAPFLTLGIFFLQLEVVGMNWYSKWMYKMEAWRILRLEECIYILYTYMSVCSAPPTTPPTPTILLVPAIDFVGACQAQHAIFVDVCFQAWSLRCAYKSLFWNVYHFPLALWKNRASLP